MYKKISVYTHHQKYSYVKFCIDQSIISGRSITWDSASQNLKNKDKKKKQIKFSHESYLI